MLFLASSGFTGPETKEWNESRSSLYYSYWVTSEMFCFLTLSTLGSACLEVLVPMGGIAFNRGQSNGSINMEVDTAIWTLWVPHAASKSAGQAGVTLLAGVTDPDYYWEIRLLLYSEGKQDYNGMQGVPWGVC